MRRNIHDLRYCFYNSCVYLCIQYLTLSNFVWYKTYSWHSLTVFGFIIFTLATLCCKDIKILVLIVGGCVESIFFSVGTVFSFFHYRSKYKSLENGYNSMISEVIGKGKKNFLLCLDISKYEY